MTAVDAKEERNRDQNVVNRGSREMEGMLWLYTSLMSLKCYSASMGETHTSNLREIFDEGLRALTNGIDTIASGGSFLRKDVHKKSVSQLNSAVQLMKNGRSEVKYSAEYAERSPNMTSDMLKIVRIVFLHQNQRMGTQEEVEVHCDMPQGDVENQDDTTIGVNEDSGETVDEHHSTSEIGNTNQDAKLREVNQIQPINLNQSINLDQPTHEFQSISITQDQ